MLRSIHMAASLPAGEDCRGILNELLALDVAFRRFLLEEGTGVVGLRGGGRKKGSTGQTKKQPIIRSGRH